MLNLHTPKVSLKENMKILYLFTFLNSRLNKWLFGKDKLIEKYPPPGIWVWVISFDCSKSWRPIWSPYCQQNAPKYGKWDLQSWKMKTTFAWLARRQNDSRVQCQQTAVSALDLADSVWFWHQKRQQLVIGVH